MHGTKRLRVRRSRSAKYIAKDNPDEEEKCSKLISVHAQSCSRMLYNREHVNFSRILEEYVQDYKRKPLDMPYWPHGPYWPLNDCNGTLYNTPVLCRASPEYKELLWIYDKGKLTDGSA